jgi:hypothetical protein
MAIDFPASPTLNQTFTSGNVNYVWDGTKWTAAVSGGIALDQITEGNTKAEVIDTGSDGRFVVTTEGSERARVDSSGRLLVGTSSYSGGSWLRVQGSGGTLGGEIDLSRGEATPADGGLLGVINFTDNTTNKGAWIFAARDGGTWSASSKPSRLVFSTTADGASSPTERMRIDSAGLVTLAGPGIKFPATQVASADANVLDDYEEGTWTPDLRAGGSALLSSGWVSNDGPRASYTRVGNCVTVLMNGRFNGFTAATGAVTIGGLPFTAADETSVGLVTKKETATTKVIGGFLSGTTISLRDQTTNASNMSPEITRADLYDYARLALCFQYRV